MSSTLTCDQSGCPLLIDGRCLEGILPPNDCPHAEVVTGDTILATSTSTSTAVTHPTNDETIGNDSRLENSEPAYLPSDEYLAGDKPLRAEEANRLLSEQNCSVILVAGEANAGKTTLFVEIWAQFLQGEFAGWRFASSRTLLALSSLHATARSSSGRTDPETARTQAEEPQFIHLAVENDAQHVEFLFSDVRGEYFEPVINGQLLGDSIPLVSRADCCIILMSSEGFGNTGARARAITRVRQLLGGLTVDGGLRQGIPVLLAWSKADHIQVNDREESLKMLDALEYEFGSRVSLTTQLIGARPKTGPFFGLDGTVEWLAEVGKPKRTDPPLLRGEQSDRYFWQPRSGDARS
ncbi:hypothetical protein HQQ82_13520 [Rathayibacter sp. VKM Ac-2856]|uniref:TRAFAC clade GTPase domain-containing protein n=1 Tax=unclassified Rathayibacter TaxID=2609250 RepID=UPI0015676B2F|nr:MULTISPECIES: hypothetical protein [unclassified Rathayibacter]NQX06052.1 hypothetical protein [Rathayibacter sp. VKM Ac-2858]NQX20998.1 hypothetical protein [Rathayibacter sp. VKM Ac-2856]